VGPKKAWDYLCHVPEDKCSSFECILNVTTRKDALCLLNSVQHEAWCMGNVVIMTFFLNC